MSVTVSASRRRFVSPIDFFQVSLVCDSWHIDRVLFRDILLGVGYVLIVSLVGIYRWFVVGLGYHVVVIDEVMGWMQQEGGANVVTYARMIRVLCNLGAW